MKSSKQLEVIVRQGAGLELVAAESSGYNSSASSVTGDQSPSSADSKRLSIVKEETLELEDRLSQLDLQSKAKKWGSNNGVAWSSSDSIRNNSCKPTIITLNGNETTIQNNGPPNGINGICKVETPPPPARQTVVAQIHRTEEEPIKKIDSESKRPMLGKVESGGSNISPISLSSAICQELQRRSEVRKKL